MPISTPTRCTAVRSASTTSGGRAGRHAPARCWQLGLRRRRALVIDMRGLHPVHVSGASATMLRTKTSSGTDSWYVMLDDMINETNSSLSSPGTKVNHPYGLKVPSAITANTTIVLDLASGENITIAGNAGISAITSGRGAAPHSALHRHAGGHQQRYAGRAGWHAHHGGKRHRGRARLCWWRGPHVVDDRYSA